MGFLELLLIGVGLSMDAFAVAVCQGLCMPKLNLRYAAVIALFFGGFQALMPYAGWLLGAQFAGYIQHLDHRSKDRSILYTNIWTTGWLFFCWHSSAVRWCGSL